MAIRHVARLEPDTGFRASPGTSVAAQWNALALDCLSRIRPALPAATRTLAILNTGMYNAWAAYDDAARQTVHGLAVRLPRAERRTASQAAAMGHAGCRVLSRVFPSCAPVCAVLLERLGHDAVAGVAAPCGPLDPAGIGRSQAAAVLEARGMDDGTPFAAQVARLAAEWQPLRQADAHDATKEDASALLTRLCRPAPQVAGPDGDVLLLFALSNALDDAARAAGAGALDAAAAEVLRRFTGEPARPALESGPTASGRQVGTLVFEKARRYWLGRL